MERSFTPDGGKTQIAHIATPQGVRIELLHVPDQHANPDLGLDAFGAIINRGAKHIGLEVEDVAVAYRQAVDSGLTILQAVTEVPLAGVKNIWLLEPDRATGAAVVRTLHLRPRPRDISPPATSLLTFCSCYH